MSAFEEFVLIVLRMLLVGWTTMKVVSFAGCRRRRMARDPHQGLKNVLFVALWAIFIGLLLFSQSHAQCWEINDVFYCPGGRETSKLDSAPYPQRQMVVDALAAVLTIVILAKCRLA